jgi:biotin synthase-related radical SAM superfamily protein
MMKVHERVHQVAEAEISLRESISAIVKKYELTTAETFMLLADSMRLDAAYCVRAERQKKGEKNE